ncbi:ankyrin [Tuber magnatum]|uniref:Ankyrin n=1 Tax=Tuber magnatum TaxID=42249 RepID=A0A317SLQ1_9PEZI|nr:ankyrin [Tuber magnatum]
MPFLQLPPFVIALIAAELTPSELNSLLRSNGWLKELLTPALLQIAVSDPENIGKKALKTAAEAGGISTVQLLARMGLPGLLKEGHHISHIYSEQIPKGICTLLNSEMFSIEARDRLGRTPLFIAAADNPSAVRCLLTFGAQPNIPDLADHTPLMEAAEHDAGDIVRLLLNDRRTRVNQGDWTGRTALYLAARWGCENATEALLEDYRTDINLEAWLLAVERNLNTPLKIARAHGHKRVVDLLLKRPDIIDGERPNRWIRTGPGYFGI